MTTEFALFRAAYPFRASSDAQLSFAAGELLKVNLRTQSEQAGWVWAVPTTIAATVRKRGGWVPFSYLVPEQPPKVSTFTPITNSNDPFNPSYPATVTPPVTNSNSNPFNPFNEDNDRDDNENDGWGPIMGGSAPPVFVADAATSMTRQQQQQQQPNRGPRFGESIGSGLKGVGSTIRQAGQKAGASIKTGAQKTGTAISAGAKETKFRMDDMMNQKRQGSSPANGNTATTKDNASNNNYSRQQRTQGEQMQLNAANGAARGALVGGTVGLVLSGGNVVHAARSAKVHAVYGGAYGAACGWTPFGK